MMNRQLFETRRQRLRGMALTHIWRGYGTALFLEFGELRYLESRGKPRRSPTGEMSMHPGWSWRFEQDGRIVLGAWSDEDGWQPVFDRLIGLRIKDVSLSGLIPEPEIEFEGGMRMRSFSLEENGPDWKISSLSPNGEPAVYLSWKDGALIETA